ncbi:hypothetical protein GPA19_00210 [Azoarcus indigens]|uniref:hypothetical protein n=1 Tax=Azoarcus indigens TaxID=29545 RepID=UPI00105D3943|nr:hypothetical protein [Azoarcus indigens]NMG63377.1 hypothetical protein [Azoarcus indigens]
MGAGQSNGAACLIDIRKIGIDIWIDEYPPPNKPSPIDEWHGTARAGFNSGKARAGPYSPITIRSEIWVIEKKGAARMNSEFVDYNAKIRIWALSAR